MNSIATSQKKVLTSKNDWDDWLSQTEGLARYWGCWQFVNPDLDESEELQEPTYPEASDVSSDAHDITDFSPLQLNIYNTLVKRYEEETRNLMDEAYTATWRDKVEAGEVDFDTLVKAFYNNYRQTPAPPALTTRSAFSATLNAFQQLVGSLNLQGQQLASLVQAIQQQTSASSPPLRARLPDPEKYDNSDPQSYPQFRSKLQAKLTCDADVIGSVKTRTWYAFHYLEGNAAKRIYPWMELNQGNPELFTPEQLISQMDAAFDDPNRRVRAAAELRRIRQSNRPYREFITDFEGKLLAANGFTWDDVLKKEYLTEVLDHDLRLAVVTLSSGLTYTQYRDAVGDATVSLERFRSSHPSRTPGKAHFHPPSSRPAPAPISAAEPTSSNARAKWVSEAEKERRKKERLCIRCGASGHFIRECPYRPATNPAPRACTAGKRVDLVQSRVREPPRRLELLEEYEKEKDAFVDPPFVVLAQVNEVANARTTPDTGCNVVSLVNSKFICRYQLEREELPGLSREVRAYDDRPGEKGYEVSDLGDTDILMGTPLLRQLGAVIDNRGQGPVLRFPEYGIDVLPQALLPVVKVNEISATAFKMWVRRSKMDKEKVQVFAVSLADIDKALKPKSYTDPRIKLPEHYHQFLDVFDHKRAETLPPLRGEGVDHWIELTEDKAKVPWGPLYQSSRKELLVLRKELNSLLDKGFIRVSNSPAAAPVLFVKKPGGGLRFCVDYRGLNAITKKDRYPLPLINETLQMVGRADWFTKLDIIASFHKIRMDPNSQWMTAFRTWYGLFEWLVTPLGLANAPSTFQKFINWTLREYLDEFVSAYIDDILIFTTGSLRKHRQHVEKVLLKLQQAGLQADIDKCEFKVKSTKYLGFIIEVGKSVRMDPAKVKPSLTGLPPHL
ncbi:hypothetical protein VTO42DRAFT_3547 [Malbranchea cinnamomea]